MLTLCRWLPLLLTDNIKDWLLRVKKNVLDSNHLTENKTEKLPKVSDILLKTTTCNLRKTLSYKVVVILSTIVSVCCVFVQRPNGQCMPMPCFELLHFFNIKLKLDPCNKKIIATYFVLCCHYAHSLKLIEVQGELWHFTYTVHIQLSSTNSKCTVQ